MVCPDCGCDVFTCRIPLTNRSKLRDHLDANDVAPCPGSGKPVSDDLPTRFVRGVQVSTPHVDAFLAEIEAVCRKHGYSISHQDCHGAFLVEKFHEDNADWLFGASVGDSVAPEEF